MLVMLLIGTLTLAFNVKSIRAGTYYEMIVLNKAVYLIEENSKNTAIDGKGVETVVRVEADNVVANFTIRNGG
jgi:hypothetical protein